MKNGNHKTEKIPKTKKPKYSIRDYQDDKDVVFDKETQARIDATIAVLQAIDRDEKLKENGKAKIPAF